MKWYLSNPKTIHMFITITTFNCLFQITEMYSSGSDLHLDLLGNNNDSIGKLWEIPPYETKAVMKATYFSKEEGLAIRFIRIVIGPPAPPTDVLILPFEMLVSTSKSLYYASVLFICPD